MRLLITMAMLIRARSNPPLRIQGGRASLFPNQMRHLHLEPGFKSGRRFSVVGADGSEPPTLTMFLGVVGGGGIEPATAAV
jgi:hypothetical protein